MPHLTVAELVGRALARLGSGHCFGVVGSGNFAVTNALRAAGVPFTAARHEGGAASMADAYARMSGRVGLLSVHQGCGLTNAATGIGEAAKSRTPMIVLAAEASAASVGSNFSMDQPGFARSVTADSHRVHSAASALADVVRAFRAARDERRTVVLNLPLDVQAQAAPEAAVEELAALVPPPAPAPPRADDSAVLALADLITRSERPVIIAGRGAREAGIELRALGAASGALLATSAVAKGLFSGDPFDLGISGGFSSPLTAELISGADLIIGVGCALNMWTMRHGRLIGPSTAIAQIDLDPAALGAQRPIDLGIVGDAASTALAVLAELTGWDEDPPARYRTPSNRARIAAESRWADVPLAPPDLGGEYPLSGCNGTERRIDPRVLTSAVDAVLPAERIVSIDSGNFMGYPSQYLGVPDEFGFCFTQAFQAVGLGLGTAVGAALARPDRLPVLGTGDGGFLMGISELETAVRLGIPLVVIVYNDDAYGAEIHHFGARAGEAAAASGGGGSGPDEGAEQGSGTGQGTGTGTGTGGGSDAPDLAPVLFPRVDIASIARGFGAEGVTVREPADLAPLRDWLAALDGPAPGSARPIVLDARIASDGGSWWLAEAFRGH